MKHQADEFTGQARTVLAHLNRGRSITDRQARRDYGISRLAAVVHKLRNKGVPIRTDLVQVPARAGRSNGMATVARYTRPGRTRGRA